MAKALLCPQTPSCSLLYTEFFVSRSSEDREGKGESLQLLLSFSTLHLGDCVAEVTSQIRSVTRLEQPLNRSLMRNDFSSSLPHVSSLSQQVCPEDLLLLTMKNTASIRRNAKWDLWPEGGFGEGREEAQVTVCSRSAEQG